MSGETGGMQMARLDLLQSAFGPPNRHQDRCQNGSHIIFVNDKSAVLG